MRLNQQHGAVAIGGLIAIKLVLLFLLAWNTRFVMDEFVQFGWAKYLGNGLFETIWPWKTVGFAVFYKLAHLIGWDATSILLIGRIQTALLACGTLALTYGCARALGNDRLHSLAILLVLLGFSNFMERSFRTIAEPLALFFAVAALLVVLRGRADRPRTVMIAGILSGLSFLATQKAVYFDVALGLALVIDAAMARRFPDGVGRGAWLVLGWLIPIVAYCFIFGGSDPLAIARSLVLGPVEVATTGADAYTNLRIYVWQTLVRNTVLYTFCFIGMVLALIRVTRLDEPTRIALVHSLVVTLLVFAHDQPWPYVFIMALPFLSLWSLGLIDRIAARPLYAGTAWVVLAIAIGASLVKNFEYLQHDNAGQLKLVANAEALIGPEEIYFDGVGMLPNRMEPSTLWLDRASVLRTLQENEKSEAFQIFSGSPPKIILWSYRMEDIYPVVAPLIRDSYVPVAPNIRMAGRRLERGKPVTFDVPVAGSYALYTPAGQPLRGQVEIDGVPLVPPLRLERGVQRLTMRKGPASALLLPDGYYVGRIGPGPDDETLFDGVYN